MQFQKNTPENTYLAHLFENKACVVFCGAGVSLEPPAGLPDWHKLRDYTLEAVASRDNFLLSFLTDLNSVEIIATPGKRGLPPEVIASHIVGNCRNYFECFRSLEDGQPNANHEYLAKMAKSGLLSYILTTNFDLFIERALKNEGLNFKVYRTEEEFGSFEKDGHYDVYLFKLHGCLSIPATITATVEEEGKGLSLAKTRVIEILLAKYFFVFWGYSGADLKIDLDYLKMVSQKEVAKGFVWNFLVRKGNKEPVNPYVSKLANIYGDRARIVHGKLPEIFDAFIVPEDKIERTKYSQEQEKAWQQQKNEKLRNSLKQWAEKYLNPALASNIFGLLFRHSGQMKAALQCLERFAQLCRELQDQGMLRTAFHNIGLIYKDQGEYDKALEYYQQATEITKTLGNKHGLATEFNCIGSIYEARGEYDQALEYFKQASEIATELDDKKRIATYFNSIGIIYQHKAKYDQALKYYKQSAEISKALGDKEGLAVLFNNIGSIYHERREYDHALEYFQQGAEISKILGRKKELVTFLNNIGMIYQHRGVYDQALKHYQQAAEISKALGDKEGLTVLFNNIGSIYHERREYDHALEYFQQGAEISKILGRKKELVTFLNNIGSIYRDRRDYDQALKHYQQAAEISKAPGYKKELAALQNNIGNIYHTRGERDKALVYYKQAAEISKALDDKESFATLYHNIGNIYRVRKEYDQALEYYQKAVEIVKVIGNKKRLSALLNNIGSIYHDLGDVEIGFQPGQDIFKQPLTAQLLLVETLFSIFESCGFVRSNLPLITEQYGDPPLFRKLRGNNNSDPYECSPKVIDIEEVLGRYIARNEQITLFADGIRWCATRLDVYEAELRFVVIIHAIAHWMVHRLPVMEADEFPLEQYEKSEGLFHETLAQLLTHWVSVRVSDSFKEVFEKLNAHQSNIYQAYHKYEQTEPVTVIKSIVDARKRDGPSTFLLLADDIARNA